ncbi:MAG: sugar transferase, partial [Actinomycetota bacterium]
SATLGEPAVDREVDHDQAIAAPGMAHHLPGLPPSEQTNSYLAEVRLSPSAPRRPVDRLLRLLDVVGALLGILVAAPILAVAAVAILATSRGPVFFSQDRVGRDGRSFRCFKLRTMRSDAESQLVNLLDRPEYVDQWQRARKLDDDPRVTRVGRILRATDLDELPQFWNVLRGEMSLVGPRPVPEDEAEWYGPDLAAVLSVRPGMTGMWQVGGRHQVSYEQRIALDVRYVATRGVWINTRLLARTVALIVSGRNGAS